MLKVKTTSQDHRLGRAACPRSFLNFGGAGKSRSGGKPETWKWFRLKGVRNPSGKV